MDTNIEIGLLMMIIAIPISMAIIPLLAKYASIIGMIDKPDPRKVHTKPVPRVGGPGIVIGSLIPVSIWLNFDSLFITYLAGSLILLTFGIWDDIKQLGHYAKFIGQFSAVILVVYLGGLYVSYIPFIGELNETAGKIFTVISMVGVINALNHSDGLDGLAGGESLMSLSAIAYISYLSNDTTIFLISLATMGGIFGFLRFNSHPAHVFMGDGGSQFLGFTLAFLVIHLTQISNPALSPSITILLIGLPIIDILAVFYQRIKGKMNWFRATKNHVHHRLLDLGFHHYESVIIIYSIQAVLVLCAVTFPYESDLVLLLIYIGTSVVLFSFLVIAKSKGWRIHKDFDNISKTSKKNRNIEYSESILKYISSSVFVLLSFFTLSTSLNARDISDDLQLTAGILFLLLITRLIFAYKVWFIYLRLTIYVSVALCAYLLNFTSPGYVLSSFSIYTFYSILTVFVMIAIRYSKNNQFEFNPLDYLFLLTVGILIFVSKQGFEDVLMISLAIQLVILFYASEIVIKQMKNRVNIFTVSLLASLGIVFFKSAI